MKSFSSIGIAGATGLVGSTLLKIIEADKTLNTCRLSLFASQASKDQNILFQNRKIPIEVLDKDKLKGLELIFFATDDPISKKWAPIAIKAGATVIDNSGSFRMDKHVPLIVPEVNGHLLKNYKTPLLIANPNCSTIQMLVALYPLHKNFGIETIRAATYQSVSGSGKAAMKELTSHTLAHLEDRSLENQVYPHDIAFNHLPQIGPFDSTGFSKEEQKMRNETRKILDDPHIKVTAFCVRTPTLNGHGQAVWVSLKEKIDTSEVFSCLKSFQGIKLMNSEKNQYPLIRQASGTDPVWVGRVHRDPDDEKTWLIWIVADNIRKGAALNAVQIAQQLMKQ